MVQGLDNLSEYGIDSEFTNRADDAADVMTHDFAQHFIFGQERVYLGRCDLLGKAWMMARRWATSGTSVLFTSQVPAFSFVPEQFWGRAARASNDSQESGRLLIFADSCDGKMRKI